MHAGGEERRAHEMQSVRLSVPKPAKRIRDRDLGGATDSSSAQPGAALQSALPATV